MALKIFCCENICKPCPGFLYDRGEHEDDWEPTGTEAGIKTHTKEADHLFLELECEQTLQGSNAMWARGGFPPPEAMLVDWTQVHTLRIRWSHAVVTGNEAGKFCIAFIGDDNVIATPGPFAERDDLIDTTGRTGKESIRVGTSHLDFQAEAGDITRCRIFEVECICD